MNDPIADAAEAETLAQELIEFAARLRRNTGDDLPVNQQADNRPRPRRAGLQPPHVALAERMYRARRLRDNYLPGELFGDPAWDLLLDLYVAQIEGRDIGVTSACVASCVPMTTALRWIGLLEEHALIERYDHPLDRRVHYLRLTSDGIRRMQAYLAQAEREVAYGGPRYLVAVK